MMALVDGVNVHREDFVLRFKRFSSSPRHACCTWVSEFNDHEAA